jgi:RHH-type rel operon transcriptional repressor/antitoxin RelB
MPTPLSIRISEETAKRLDRLARETGRTKAFYIRKLIEENLEDMEDYYLAAERFAESRRKGTRPLTSEEVSRELELDD